MFSFLKKIFIREDIVHGDITQIPKRDLEELVNKQVLDDLVLFRKNPSIFYLGEQGLLFDYFEREEHVRQLFHDQNFELFDYVIGQEIFNDQMAQNRLLMYISEFPENDKKLMFQRRLIKAGVPIKLLKYHNKANYLELTTQI